MRNARVKNGPQYLEDLATAYWYSEALFTAVELGLFTRLEPGGKTPEELAAALGLHPAGLERFLHALCALGLVARRGEVYFNTEPARTFLVEGAEDYQGDSILWRKYLFPGWRSLRACLEKGGRVHFAPADEPPEEFIRRVRRYSRAMDGVARTKAKEILPLFDGAGLAGEMLDAGAGAGAVAAGFLERFPGLRATLLDLPEVLDYAEEVLEGRECRRRVSYCPANILEPWPLPEESFDLVVLSNIIHVYGGEEARAILERAAGCLKKDGLLLIHDFFFEHCPEKAALFDLNMFVNTFNGRVYPAGWVRGQLAGLGLHATELLTLASDTALVIAGKDPERLKGLRLEPELRHD
ncbi:MAG: methyltransferase domain-containing protein [Peptococcaceae bacterium]|nr:methyltransferase domain-containing protein [Peptococcaceae bacterium]